jgi:nucleoid DNA-binding protein
MTNEKLIETLAENHDLPKAKTKRIIKDLVGIIRGEVQAHRRQAVADLGVFTLRDYAPREVQGYKVPARKGVHFKAARNWKRAVNLK